MSDELNTAPVEATTETPAENAAPESGTKPESSKPAGSLLFGIMTGEDDAKGGEESADSPASASAAPEKYDLKVPENLAMQAGHVAAFENGVRMLGLSNEQAQGILEIAQKNQQESLQVYAEQVGAWADEVKSDRELGGVKLKATQQYAAATLRQFDDGGQLYQILEQTGYANHPAVIRMLSRIGRGLVEDTAITGKGQGETTPLHERLYGNNQG